MSRSGLPLDIDLSCDIYFSFEANGYFAKITAGREFETTDRLSVNLGSTFGINQGYVIDGHDGSNHIALRFGLDYVITKSVSVTAHVNKSWALDRNEVLLGDNPLIDFFSTAALTSNGRSEQCFSARQ